MMHCLRLHDCETDEYFNTFKQAYWLPAASRPASSCQRLYLYEQGDGIEVMKRLRDQGLVRQVARLGSARLDLFAEHVPR